MKKTGKCPKCLQSDIYTNKGEDKRGDRAVIAVSSWKSLVADTYLCLHCGFVEEYIRDRDLKAKVELIKTNWKKYSL